MEGTHTMSVVAYLSNGTETFINGIRIAQVSSVVIEGYQRSSEILAIHDPADPGQAAVVDAIMNNHQIDLEVVLPEGTRYVAENIYLRGEIEITPNKAIMLRFRVPLRRAA